MAMAAQAVLVGLLAESSVWAPLLLTIAKNFSLHGSGIGVVPVAPGVLHLAASDNHAPIFRPSNDGMRRANGNDNDLSRLLADRRQRPQISSPRFAAIVKALVNLLDCLARQYTVDGPSNLRAP